jgi:hypothetical protein
MAARTANCSSFRKPRRGFLERRIERVDRIVIFESEVEKIEVASSVADRAKRGNKRHSVCDGRGIPLDEVGRSDRTKLHELPRLHLGVAAEVFLWLACALICWKFLQGHFP